MLKNVLIVGVGSIGLRHLRCFQQTGRAKVSFCEVNSTLRARVAEEYRIERHFPTLEAALADDTYDAAVIATPAPLHVSMGQRLADAGIHLFLEKPLGTNLDGVDHLQETVSKRGLMAAVAYVFRANPVLESMRAAILSGRFGRPVQITASSGAHLPHHRPAYREIYYNNRATGGGAVQDAMTHTLNAAEWLLGPVDRLVADAAHQVLEGISVEDTVHVLTRHGDVLGCYNLNEHQAPDEWTITVVCDRGTARFENHRYRWRWAIQPDEAWHDEAIPPFARDFLYIRQANRFLDALDGRASPACTLMEGIQTLRVNLAVLESIVDGGWRNVSRAAVAEQKEIKGREMNGPHFPPHLQSSHAVDADLQLPSESGHTTHWAS